MTEAEWLACETPMPMLDYLKKKVSARKLRLFGCSCARRTEMANRDLGGDEFSHEILINETLADAHVKDDPKWERQWFAGDYLPANSCELFRDSVNATGYPNAFAAAREAASQAASGFGYIAFEELQLDEHAEREAYLAGLRAEQSVQAGLLRDIFGNPFRAWPQTKVGRSWRALRDIFGAPFSPVTFSPLWRTSTAVALASQMYESWDFGATPILADALQDAGCDNDDILSHCRGPGPHVRGCWVVDTVLGKE